MQFNTWSRPYEARKPICQRKQSLKDLVIGAHLPEAGNNNKGVHPYAQAAFFHTLTILVCPHTGA